MASYYKNKKGNTFTVSYRLLGGGRRFIYGIKTENTAKKARDRKSNEEQLVRAGLMKVDFSQEKIRAASRKSIKEHIADFEAFLVARGDKPRHAAQQASHVRRLCMIGGVRAAADITLEKVQRAIGKLLGPRCGPRTCNAARGAIIHFEKCLLRDEKIHRAVLHGLRRFNEQIDIRRKRRALTQEEIDWLLSVTPKLHDRTSRQCGISPADRAMLYRIGLATGFRRGGLLNLVKADFFVTDTAAAPFIRLSAKHSKNGKSLDQLIPKDLASMLRQWLSNKPDAGPVWQPRPHADLALRFRRDLEATRQAWIDAVHAVSEREQREQSNILKYVYQVGDQRIWADFHSLRHTSITFVVRGAGLWVGQKWADQSTPVLTMKYTHTDQSDIDRVTDALPSLVPFNDHPTSPKAQARGLAPTLD